MAAKAIAGISISGILDCPMRRRRNNPLALIEAKAPARISAGMLIVKE
jgi:hypothetical protein